MTYTNKNASTLARHSSRIKSQIREFFDSQGFLEVDTPIMVKIPGMEPHLSIFETKLEIPSTYENQTPQALYLNHSPELQMKKLLARTSEDATFGKIYNMAKVFRNGEFDSKTHNPEFTMLEWYRYDSDYNEMMTDCENLIAHLTKNTTNTASKAQLSPHFTQNTPQPENKNNSSHNLTPSTHELVYQDQKIDLSHPFTRKTVNELFIEHTNIDLNENKTYKQLKEKAENLKLPINSCETWDDIFFTIFLNEIEPKLKAYTKPIFIYDYPSSQAALARKSHKDPFWAERFELYIAGIEIANAYSELIDEKEQRDRLIEEQNQRKNLKKSVFDIDEEFLNSLKSIRKPCSGIALGVDRLIMLLTDTKSIEDLLLFPITHILKK